ncbi:MAG: acyl-CoA dehydrogenase family protein [Candidatus Eremiobacteraeota bacterium]|nr:acyl-CoA dehydrogenase family protein [Candidatus Eremiobacteraeota bacterium]
MDFTLSPEQLLIKDSVARFAAGAHAGTEKWPQFAELGWLAIGAPDDLGGFGGPIETLLLMEQFGRGLVVSPYVAQVVLAGTILRVAERTELLERLVEGTERFAVAYEEPHARYDAAAVGTSAVRDGEAYVLRGEKVRVLDASTANTLIVSARTGDEISLFAVPSDAANVTREKYASEDGYDVANVRLDGVRVDAAQLVGPVGGGLGLLERALDHATAALCAEGLGLMSLMLEATVEYTKQRQQFGVPIGSFQALQHRMAEMFIEVELARSMAYLAAMTLDEQAEDPVARRRGISAAKVQIAKSGRFVAQHAIQLHGGIGMSEEYKVGHYFKRITMVERLLGDADFHLRRYIASRGATLMVAPDRDPVGASGSRAS